ncbi:methyltransferase domain-containing protein, partial [Patescibacteria group bacterium]|nr:methyltransferase domain-containing protein [Patescibacteria group bacterium]
MKSSIEKAGKLRLHMGCGDVLLLGFINMDIRDEVFPDKVSLVYPVDYADGTFDMVYASHILEHFPGKQTLNVLQEWVRILKRGGILRLSVPNFEALINIYKRTKDLDQIIGPLYGKQNYRYNYHNTVFDLKTLKGLMEKAGLTAVHWWDFRRTEHSDHWDYSQAETKGIL